MKALWGFNKSDYLSSLTLSSARGMVMITTLKSDLQTQDCSYYCGNSLLEPRRDFSCTQSWVVSPWSWEMPFWIVCQFVNCVTCFLSAEFLVLMCFDVDPFSDVSSEKIFLHVGKSALHFVHFYSFCTDIYSLILSYLTFLYVLYFLGCQISKTLSQNRSYVLLCFFSICCGEYHRHLSSVYVTVM